MPFKNNYELISFRETKSILLFLEGRLQPNFGIITRRLVSDRRRRVYFAY